MKGCTLALLYVLRLPIVFTVASWPNFRPNNSKEAPKIVHGPKKLEAVKWQNLPKRARKYLAVLDFYQLFIPAKGS
jgi:hypothetical protein